MTYTEAMGAQQASLNFHPVIWAQLMQAPKEPISPDAARYLLSIDFSEADHTRMQELMDKSNEGMLTSEDETEFDSYLDIANLLTLMHSQARVALRKAGFEPPRDARDS